MEPTKEELKKRLRERIKGTQLRRMKREQQVKVINKECEKMGLDPEQIMKNMSKRK